MTRKERMELKEFKDKYIQNFGEFEDWSEYMRYCDDQGFSESEVGYDELIIAFGKYKGMKGLIGPGYKMEWYFTRDKN
ncbi:MAG: hypothetical protein SLAVMIC_00954 [uncultured marine phage]|uniref:Uncharacterized protein n=1 Tax=uncultured marine phage TaxID=707152 RepID=A0A8D9CCF8_9VIRU|nr:MAG: hypothetical protein SLAVMIC_00954 [uncultured marine phage]